MPKLGEYQFLLDIVAFLYPDEASARAGRDAGGTGFFVTIPSATYPEHYHHAYAVTNHHVALGARGKRPCPVVRVNKLSGPPEVFPFDDTEWQFIGGGPDVAVVPITLNLNQLKVSAIAAASFFLTAAEIAEHEINAAEDVFMLGRFIDYDGIEENLPSMRFGNISMMAAKVQQTTGYSGNSYVVDMHSRTGFSGSPVFVYRTAGSIFAKPNRIMGGGHFMKLLGILWGQFPEEWDLKDRGHAQSATVPVLDGKTIKGMSGMSLVCPAAEIWRVLNMPDLKKHREQVDASLHQHFAAAAGTQSAAPPARRREPPLTERISTLYQPRHCESLEQKISPSLSEDRTYRAKHGTTAKMTTSNPVALAALSEGAFLLLVGNLPTTFPTASRFLAPSASRPCRRRGPYVWATNVPCRACPAAPSPPHALSAVHRS
jgi:hypothetical protein